MQNFKNYTTPDFLAEESFVNYLLQKNLEDINFWKNWIRENPACRDDVEEARNFFFIIQEEYGDIENERFHQMEEQYSAFSSVLGSGKSEANTERKLLVDPGESDEKKNNFRRILLYAASIAAIFLMAVSISVFFKKSLGFGHKDEFVLVAKTINNTQEVSLPDGSHLELNNNSTIKIASDYNSNKREVLLTGSAFFQVQKNPSKPFIVTAGVTKTTALGTSFYIYGLSNKFASVSLVEGKVRVEKNRNQVELIPSQKAIYKSGQNLIKGSFNIDQFLLWRKGEIRFKHAHWGEIKTVVEEYFNKEVLVKGTIPKFNFTGSFSSQKIETILDALSFTYNAEYKLNEQHVIIAFK